MTSSEFHLIATAFRAFLAGHFQTGRDTALAAYPAYCGVARLPEDLAAIPKRLLNEVVEGSTCQYTAGVPKRRILGAW